jgi:hypothetical protein
VQGQYSSSFSSFALGSLHELKNSCSAVGERNLIHSDIGEGEAAPVGDHAPDAGGGRDPQVEDRAHQGRHRCRLQGPRQARKGQPVKP